MKKIILLMLFLFILSNFVYAKDVEVGLYVLNLGKFDIGTGSFTADFYLSLTCDEECPNMDFEFMNGRATTIDKIIEKKDEKFYRIQANLNSPVNLMNFPFDTQKMQIILEDKKNQIDEIRYVPSLEHSGIDESIVFTGWNIDGWNASSTEHYYDIYDETYSQYIFSINISRIRMNSFMKTFMPVLVIMLITLSSFILDPDKITTRLGMAGSGLVASVMFHISITNQIPPVGYLTIADKFMILTYLILLMTFIINVTLLELLEQKKQKIVMRIHTATEYSMLAIVPMIYIIFFILV